MLPLQEGVSDAKRIYGDEAAGPPLQKIKNGATLTDLAQDYGMFTYAPLCIFGGLEHNPVQEWINHNNHQQVVFILKLDDPYIRLGGPPIFDRTLWLVEKQYWESLALHIGSMAFLNKHKRILSRVVCQDLLAPDVVALKKLTSSGVPRVIITTFSVDNNLGCLAFKPGTVLTQWRPHLAMHPAREETVKLANALFANSSSPYTGIQPLPWEKTDEASDPHAASVGSRDGTDAQDGRDGKA